MTAEGIRTHRSGLQTETTMLPVGAWELALRRHHFPGRADPGRRPLVMVPGYAMNTFILGYHPTGMSMIEHLAAAGIDVWTIDLRGQGDSRPTGSVTRYGLGELALDDLPAALAAVRSRTGQDQLDIVGCSLGGSLVYAYLAHHPDDHGLGAVVSIGGPLRWVAVHPVMKLAFRSSTIAGLIPIKGTRAMARRALPVVRHAPSLLSIYMNAGQIDLSAADQLVNTVDDPVRHINRQVARWVQQGDLSVRGLDITQALTALASSGHAPPILAVAANNDGIVPVATARSIELAMGTDLVTALVVGDQKDWFAHADLFISNQVQGLVFDPIERWLAGQAD